VAAAGLAAVIAIPSLLGGNSSSPSAAASASAAINGQQAATAASQTEALSAEQEAQKATATGAGSTSQGQPDAVPVTQPQVIRTGAVDLRVSGKRLNNVYDSASNDAAAVGGYVESSSTSVASSDSPSAMLVLRIPSASFQKVVGEIAGIGKVLSESTQGQDVTGTIINIDARIANLTAEESALRKLIGQAGTIPHILTVENQLFGVEEQIEELSGQQSSLANQVTYGTLSINLAATAAAPAKVTTPKPQNAFSQGAKLALHNTAASLHGIAIAVGAAFPALIVAALALVGFGLARRRRRPAVEAAK
jgi:hypothetical protein